MQRAASVILGLFLFVAPHAGCWHGAPRSPPASAPTPEVASPAEASYRHATLAVDAVGIGLLAASTVAYSHRGGNDPLSVGLVLAGGLTAALGTPIVHGLHRHGERAVASYLFRSMFVSVGVLVGIEVGCARSPGWFCGLGPELGWGMVGGFALASSLDALLLHSPSSTWTPIVTPAEGGAQIGVATRF